MSIFALFGVKLDQDSFAGAMRAIAALHVAAAGLHKVMSFAGDLVDMATGAAKAGTHIAGLSAGLGMSIKSVQEWKYVAEQAGSTVDAWARGVSMAERNMANFAQGRGSKAFKESMEHMHISMKQAKDAMTGPDGMNGIMFLLADRYKEMGLQAIRGADNTRIFGARNREFAHDLSQGSEYIKEQIKHAHELGLIISDLDVANLKKFDNSIKDVQGSLHALAMQVVASLAPAFREMLEGMAKWIAENRVMLGDLLRGAFEVLAFVFQALFTVVKALGAAVQGVMNGDTGMILLFSLAAGAVALLAGAIIAMAIPAIIAMGTALWIAMAPLLPWSLALAAIIAVVLLLATHWEEVCDFMAEHWQLVLAVFLPFIGIPLLIIKHWETVKAWLAGFGSWLYNILGDLGRYIIALFAKLGEWVIDLIPVGDSWDDFRKGGGDAIDFLIAKLKDLGHEALKATGPVGWAIDRLMGDDDNGSPSTRPSVPTHQTRGGQAAAMAANAASNAGSAGAGSSRSNSVSIGPTTINIHGVKDAQEAQGHIADANDAHLRHAAASLASEVQ